MKLNDLVSIVKKIIESKLPSKEGKIVKVRAITKNTLANDS